MLPRPAPTRRSPLRTRRHGRSGRLGDAGQATLECAGGAVLVGAIVLALVAVPVGPQLAEALRLVIRKITGGDRGAADPVVPRCVLSSRGESVAHSGHLGVDLGVEQGSTVELLGDGGASLVTEQGAHAGVHAALGGKAAKGSSSKDAGESGGGRGGPDGGSAEPERGASGEGGPDLRGPRTEPDDSGPPAGGQGQPDRAGSEAADEELVELQALVGVDGGGTASAVRTFSSQDELLTYRDGSSGAGQSAVDVVTGVGGRDAGSAVDSVLRRAGVKEEDPHPPDAYRVKVDAAVTGDASVAVPHVAEAEAGFHGGRDGTLERRTDGSGFTHTGAVDGSAMAGASLLEWGGTGEGVAAGRVAITFDDDMNPTDLTFVTDVENTRDGEGTATTRTTSLRLQDSDREAVMAAMPALVGSPDPVAVAASAGSLAYIGRRMDRDGVDTRTERDVAGSEDESGWAVAFLARVGVSRVKTTDERTPPWRAGAQCRRGRR